MFENFSNVIFIAVALAIFLGRTIAQARKQRAEEEKNTAEGASAEPEYEPMARQKTRRTPLVLLEEEEDDYIPGYLKKPSSVSPVKPPAKKQAAKPAAPKAPPPLPSPSFDELFPMKASAAARTSSAGQDFAFNLNHLSPLKQAVIMAEVLGPPKALSSDAGER
ncbi:MAG: hypothetical protein FWD91_05620 [Treponema sp.]|nr:hypothetical protein [Treponema sp.]